MEGDNMIPELDKSFCLEKNSIESIKNYNESGNLELDSPQLNFKKEDLIYFSDDDFSACLIPTNQKKVHELNFSSPSSNELNIFDSTDPKYILRPHFFRMITKTNCETSHDEEKYLIDKIQFYNKQIIKLNQNDRDNLKLEKEEDKMIITNNLNGISNNYNINNVNIRVSINNKKEFTIEEDLNESEFYNFEKNINNDKASELKIFEKNKMRYSNLNSASFNILVVGVKDSGKTSFIKYSLKRLKNSMEIQKSQNKNQSQTNSNLCKNSKNSPSNCKNSSNSFFSSNNFNSSSCTNRFKTYKLRCVSFNNNTESSIYDMNMIDSPGNDCSNNKKWLNDIIKFIRNRYEEYYNKKENPQKLKDENSKETDCRIHLCLYFLTTQLTSQDLECMREISKWTNLIPIIGKGDKLSDEEILSLKSRIMLEGKEKNIQFMDLYAALNKLSKDPLKVNYLLGGNHGFCPPFLICTHNSLNHSYDSQFDLNLTDNEDKSDLSRLYLILTCFIPFECVERTKKFYKIFKNSLKLRLFEEKEKKYRRMIWAATALPMIGLGLLYAFKSKKGEN